MVVQEKFRFWEKRIISEFNSNNEHDKSHDVYGQEMTGQLVTDYLLSQRERLVEVLFQTMKYSPGPKVAEVGAAFGSCLLPLSEDFGFKVVGYDLEENIHAYCRALIRSGIPVGALDFHEPQESESVAADQFDFVICSEVVEHIFVDVGQVAKRLAKMVRTGGRVLVTTPNTYRLRNIQRVLRGYNANESHPSVVKRVNGIVVDSRTHPREYTMFEIIEAFSSLAEWKVLSAWTWPTEKLNANSLRERLQLAVFRSLFRLPEGGLVFCVAERIDA